jgi:excisionase family DNA binding protein
MTDEPLTMTTAEAAARLGVTESWLAAAAVRGEVPSRKLRKYRRFTEQDLADYLASVREGGDAPRLSRLTRTRRT